MCASEWPLTYSPADLMRLTGATKSQYTYWTKQDVVRADVQAATGTGHHSRFSFFGLLQARLALHLNSVGMAAPKMRFLMAYLRMLEATARSEDHVGERILTAEVRRAAKTIGRQVKADPKRIVEIVTNEVQKMNSEVASWRAVRRPGPERDRFSFIGFWYSIDPFSGDILPPQLLAVPKESRLEFGGGGGAAVMLNIGDTLRELEQATGDSLSPS